MYRSNCTRQLQPGVKLGQRCCQVCPTENGFHQVSCPVRLGTQVLDHGTIEKSDDSFQKSTFITQPRRFRIQKFQRQLGFQTQTNNFQLGMPKVKVLSQKGPVCKPPLSPRFTIRNVATHCGGPGNGSHDLSLGGRGLSVPPSTHATSCPSQNTPGQGESVASNMSVTNKHLVFNNAKYVPRGPSNAATSSSSTDQTRHRVASSLENSRASSYGTKREDLKQQGFNDGAIELIQNNIKSIKTYKSHWKKFCDYCLKENVDPFTCPVPVVSNYLHFLFQRGLKYRSVCTHASAVSKYHHLVSDRPIGVHPYITEVLKDVFLKKPPIPKYQTTWNVDIHLKTSRYVICEQKH